MKTTSQIQAEIITKYNLGPLTITDMNGNSELIPNEADMLAGNYKKKGNKFNSQLPLKEIASKIREELKQFKGCKFSVRTRTAGTHAIDLDIIEVPFCPYSSEYLNYLKTQDYEYYNRTLGGRASERYNETGKYLLKEVTKIFDSYNYDNSDSMTDYFDCNYYGVPQYAYNCKYVAPLSQEEIRIAVGSQHYGECGNID